MLQCGGCLNRLLFLPALSVLMLVAAQSAAFGQGQWKCANPKPPYQPRESYGALVYNEKMWVFFGVGLDYGTVESHDRKDVWHSANGADWTCAASDVNIEIHCDFPMVNYNGFLWIPAGHQGQ